MGDTIEITTHARQPTAIYKVSSGALGFEVKALNSALVGLTKEPGTSCNYWIGFGNGGRIWIKGPEGLRSSSGGNYFLAPNQFKRFWIAWDRGNLRVGQGQDTTHIISYPNNVVDLNYITFSTHDVRNPATWKFQLSPACLINIRNNIPCKKIEGGELRWITAADALPDDAVIGGFEAECLYIIRGNHANSLTPGKFVPSEGVAYVSWGGTANETSAFEILCGYNYTWEPTSEDKIPANAFVAGYSEVNQEKLYIGRVKHMDCIVPGKVQPSHKVCYVAFAERELPFKEYEILTIPELNPYPAKYLMATNIHTLMRHLNEMHANDFRNHIVVNINNDDNDEEDEFSEEDEDNGLNREWVDDM